MTTLPGTESTRSPIHGFLQWIWYLSRDSTLRQLHSSEEREIKGIASATGMSGTDRPGLVNAGSHAGELLESRLAALGLDPKEIYEVTRQTLYDMQRVCALCTSHGRCRRDLARNPTAATWNDYCPNADMLMSLEVLPWAWLHDW